VVEGVETVEELQTLAAIGLHCIQGYVFSKPIPATNVPDWYHAHMPHQRAALQSVLHPADSATAVAHTPFLAPRPTLAPSSNH